MKKLLVLSAALLLAACADKPKVPDWQMEARGALDRFVPAYMEGNTRVEQAEFARARREVGATGKIDLIARVELTRCAARVAALVFEPCAGFEALRQDAPAPERAYADYLAGRGSPVDAGKADAFSRLIAAGVQFQAGRATPETIASSIETASTQGWRRPLLAWLGVQLQRADAAGATEEAARIRRRISLILADKPPA